MTNDEILTKLCKFDQFGPAKIQRICKWGNTRAIAKIIELVDSRIQLRSATLAHAA